MGGNPCLLDAVRQGTPGTKIFSLLFLSFSRNFFRLLISGKLLVSEHLPYSQIVPDKLLSMVAKFECIWIFLNCVLQFGFQYSAFDPHRAFVDQLWIE